MQAKTRRVFAGTIFFLLALVLSAGVVHASPGYLSDFTTAYPASATANAGCQVCHVNPNASPSSPRNVYGTAWAAANYDFAVVGAQNSDGVGGTNDAEIAAGTQPGWCVQTTPGCLQTTGTPPAVPLDDVAPPPTNRPPVLATIGAKSVNEGQALTFTATATDPDGNALTFSGSNLPTGAAVTPAGVFSWTPTFTQAGNYNVTITVTDNGTPAASDFEIVTITVGNVNRPPVLGAIAASQTATEGQAKTILFSATDPDGDTLVFAGSNMPTGAILTNNGNGAATFAWTPTFAQAGSYPNVTITVTDNGSPPQSASAQFTITVADANQPPVLAPIGAKRATVNVPFTFTATATDPDGNALTFSAGNLPAGATLTPAGVFSWTPTATGSYPNVTITVTDNGSPPQNDSETFTITVGNVNGPPVLTSIGAKTVNEAQTLSFTATATDPDGDPLTFSAGNLPAGATLTPAGVFSWTPTFDQAGNYNVTITVTDGALTASETITITVGNVNRPPVLSPSPIGNRTVAEGQTLTIAITASDPDGGTLTFTSANLPTGATLTPSGNGAATFSWTPGAGQAGSYPDVTITVSDGALTDSELFTITVGPAAPQPITLASFTASPGGALAVGTPVTVTATASGGVAPYQYKWWLWNGSAWTLLQPDWTPSNTFTWTPSTAGSFQLGVWVRNSGTTADTWEVYGALPVTVTAATVSLAASPGAVGTLITVTATATGVTTPTYRFWLWNGSAWSVLREWGTASSFLWTPTAAGNYQLGVWVKPSSVAGDVWAAYGAVPVTIAPATVSLTANPGSAGNITLTATATGVTTPTYRFWLWNGSAWSVLREWGTASSFLWTPTAAGNYQLGVWVKPSSVAGDVWAAYGAVPVTVTAGTSPPRQHDNDD